MMRAPYLKNNGIADSLAQYQEIFVQCVVKGNTNDTLIKVKTDFPGIYGYCEIGGVQPSTTGVGALLLQDADANFPAFDSNADPSSFGLLFLVGDAETPVATSVGLVVEPQLQVIKKPSAATLTITNRGGSTNGVTTSKNLAFNISCAGVDFDAAIADFEFLFKVVYRRKLNAVGPTN